jgi:hypothetical protein
MWDFWFVKLVAIAPDLLGCTTVAVTVTILLGFPDRRRWEEAWVSPKIAKGEAPQVLNFFSFNRCPFKIIVFLHSITYLGIFAFLQSITPPTDGGGLTISGKLRVRY